MEASELINSIKKTGRTTVTTDENEKCDLIKTTKTSGWLSKKQISFLFSLAEKENQLNIFPKEGGWILNMKVERGMPNGCRGYSITSTENMGKSEQGKRVIKKCQEIIESNTLSKETIEAVKYQLNLLTS